MSDVITRHEQEIRALQAKLQKAQAREEQIGAECRSLGYQVHVENKGRKALDALIAEQVGTKAEILSLQGALEQAGKKLEAARVAARREADEDRARELLKLVAEWDAAVDKLADAAAILESQSQALVTIHSKISQLGAARPTRPQVDAVAGRARLTTTMRTPWQNQFGTRFLPPHERHVFQDLKQYSDLIRTDAEQRIGKKEEAA